MKAVNISMFLNNLSEKSDTKDLLPNISSYIVLDTAGIKSNVQPCIVSNVLGIKSNNLSISADNLIQDPIKNFNG